MEVADYDKGTSLLHVGKKFYSTCPMRTNFCSKLAVKDKIARGGRAVGSGGELGSGGARARGRESARANCYKTLFN